jgi:5-methylcytosine-specific restriction endonuclease McrA
MIKLTKHPKPTVLTECAETWTKALIDKIAAGQEPTQIEKSRYRHKEVKAALVVETNGKCAYCESKLLHVTYGDVEHIIPKSSDPTITFEWENLTLACDVCNTNKGNHFKGGAGLIDPYIQEPSEHYRIVGPFLFALPGDDDARLTELTLKLNRTELLERREQKIRYLREQLEVVVRADEPLKALLLANLEAECSPSEEYSAFAKAFLRAML